MLKKRALSLLAAVVAVPGMLIVAGCGGDDGGSDAATGDSATVDFAQAASSTAAKGTAKVKISMSVSGGGLPMPVDLEADGVTDLNKPRLNMSMNFGKLLEAAGQPATGDATATVKVDGKSIWIKVPKLEGLELPGNKSWVGIDLERVLRALGVDGSALNQVFGFDPASQIKMLTNLKSIKEVGKEDLNGTAVTHFSGRFSAREIFDGMDKDRKEAFEQAMDKLTQAGGTGAKAELDKMLDEQTPIDLWVDGDSVVHRQMLTQKVASAGGTPAGSMKFEYSLSDFGADLDVSPPPAGDTAELTDTLVQGLSALSGVAAGAGITVPTP